MSDDLASKLKILAESLKQDDIPDELKGLVGLFKDSLNKSNKEKEEPIDLDDSFGDSDGGHDNFGNDGFSKLKNLVVSDHDDKINLLLAIKPFLNEHRQKRTADCIKLLRMGSLSKLFDGKNGLF